MAVAAVTLLACQADPVPPAAPQEPVVQATVDAEPSTPATASAPPAVTTTLPVVTVPPPTPSTPPSTASAQPQPPITIDRPVARYGVAIRPTPNPPIPPPSKP